MLDQFKKLIKSYGSTCDASNAELAEQLGCTDRTIRRHVATLRNAGLIECKVICLSGGKGKQRIITNMKF